MPTKEIHEDFMESKHFCKKGMPPEEIHEDFMEAKHFCQEGMHPLEIHEDFMKIKHFCKEGMPPEEIHEDFMETKHFCKEGMPPEEIHEDFLETLGNVSPSYSTVIKRAASLRGGNVEDDGRSVRPKDATGDENVKVVHTLVMCDRKRDLGSIASEVGISFGAVQSILTDILGMSKFRQDRCRER